MVLILLTVVAIFASFAGASWSTDRPEADTESSSAWCVGLVIGGAVLSLPTFLARASSSARLGGVWTSDRVFMLRLSPADKVGEFFGLYGLAGKFSAVTGPVVYGVVVSTLLDAGWGKGAYQAGILSFLVLMFVGVWILRTVPDPGPESGGVAAPPEHLLPSSDMPGPGRH
jgi:MFS-type transporter involved in bile tolerance (Atg22 family)